MKRLPDLKFEIKVSQLKTADTSVQRIWVERETGAEFSVCSKTGGPGWDGAHFMLAFREQQIKIFASWPTAFGEYFVDASTISMPRELLEYRSLIEKLIFEGISVFCASEYVEDFSPSPFTCSVKTSRLTYIHG